MTADTTYTPPEHLVAIVTGAGRGIGAAIAERLGADGMAVACLDIDEATAKETADRLAAQGVRAAAFAADVSDEDAVERVVGEVVEALGAPTVLVNNAGVLRDNLLFKMSGADWDTVMQVHLRGTFLMTRAAQRHMTAAQWGRVVNLSSTSALGNRGQANYAAAKAGLIGLSKTIARELGSKGITCNVVAPGFIQTDMTNDLPQQVKDHVLGLTAVKRFGTPQDVAAAVAYATSDEAGFLSGQVICVDGGMTMC